jgi:hypothetical protein
MTSILYYSNLCEPSKSLLQLIAKTKLKEEVHFICIDKRVNDSAGQIYLQLENNQRVILPPTVTKVPALLLLTQGHKVLFGEQIYEHLKPQDVVINHVETSGNGEPEAYSLGQMSSMSDAYSFWDQSAEDLSAKGSGGVRQLHSFVTLEQQNQIMTPPDDYEPDKVGNNGSKTIEQYQAERDEQVSAPLRRE